MLLGLGAIVVTGRLVATDRLPRWSLFLSAATAIAASVRAQSLWDRSRPADALTPWADFQVLRGLTTETAGETLAVTLLLARDVDLASEVIALRFVDVRRLSITALGIPPLVWSLRCDDRGADFRRGPRYRIRDRHGELLDVGCNAFEIVLRDPGADPQ